jgi:hypothetical protein
LLLRERRAYGHCAAQDQRRDRQADCPPQSHLHPDPALLSSRARRLSPRPAFSSVSAIRLNRWMPSRIVRGTARVGRGKTGCSLGNEPIACQHESE